MSNIEKLLQEILDARLQFLEKIAHITEIQSKWKPQPEAWNITDITEHLFWAEHNGIGGMWEALYEIRSGKRIRTYEFEHKNMTIEEVIAKTWQTHERVPEGAGPHEGGPISYWLASFKSLQSVLNIFATDLQENELRLMAQPHPISGPLDFHQRLEFLRFHIDRHRMQAEKIIHLMTV